jgi:hypothetical protein
MAKVPFSQHLMRRPPSAPEARPGLPRPALQACPPGLRDEPSPLGCLREAEGGGALVPAQSHPL